MLGAATIADIAHLMSSLYRLAMHEHPPLVIVNPFADLELPEIGPRPVEFYERDEAAALYEGRGGVADADRAGHGRRPAAGRTVRAARSPGRLAARPARGRGRDDPPGPAPAPEVEAVSPGGPGAGRTLEGMSRLMAGRPRDSLVFTAPQGGPVTDGHFRNRVWYPAVVAAGIHRFPPRVMRHTAASWLVQDGVPLYDVQALLGHEDYATTQRYAHLAPDAHGKVIESWARRRDARLTHEAKGSQTLMAGKRPLTLVGVAGFEPAASSSRTKRAAKLRHTPAGHVARLQRGSPDRPAKSSGCRAALRTPWDEARHGRRPERGRSFAGPRITCPGRVPA